MLLEHWSRLYRYVGALGAYGHAEFPTLPVTLPTLGTFMLWTMAVGVIELVGVEKQVGWEDTTDERWFIELSPQGKAFEPSGLGTLAAQLL